MRVRLQFKLKPDNYTESCMVDVADKRVAVPSNPHVHMETMKKPKDQTEKSYENGNPRVLCVYGGKQPQRALVQLKLDNGQKSDDERKTDKQWLLRFSHSLSVCARQLLKAPYTRTVCTVL